jgi:hypothetical protein
MTVTEYAVTLARTFMAAEIAMASVNCGAVNVTRAQAEKLLGNYFALVEQAITRTEVNRLTTDPDPSAPQRDDQKP